jgi:hypothetical protein
MNRVTGCVLAFILLISPAAFASDAITVTDLTNNRIYQRDIGSTTTDIAISGTYTGTDPSSVEYQIVQAGTSTVVKAWATVAAATISGGTWSGTASDVPQGNGYLYNIQVRDGGITAISDTNNTNAWGVGVLVLIMGQSNGYNWTIKFTGGGTNVTANDLLRYYTGSWADPTTACNGAIQFANTITEATGLPVGILNYSSNANPLMYEGVTKGHSAGSSFLGDTPTFTKQTLYTNAISAVTAVGGKVEYVLWIGSESDWEDTVSNYEGGLATLFTYLKTDIDPGVKLICNTVAAYTDPAYSYANMSGWPIIRNSTIKVCNANDGMYVGAMAYVIPISTSYVHYSDAGYTTHGTRMAQTVLYIMGEENYYRGAYITGFTQVDATHVDVTIAHRGGTDFTPTGANAITGFQVFDGAFEKAITDASRTSATNIRLTTSSDMTGDVSVRYMFHNNPTTTGAVKDNSALALPLEPYSSDYPVGASWNDSTPSMPTITNATIGGGATVQ